ncbi:hypothetical protein [Nannocystis sp. SCPEA4]|uniref:hypothetical protein n=1 Tax=Nannocystis sp. SCPEA4 TaxID=2996787 RepID=UPI00226D9B59|nr:hypothetical protein [Nannocystis sp. SCPEA4]MCY1054287.1 hypothetical protein [Nannocystis sp. SCPEA4]
MKRRASPSLLGITVFGVAACTAPGLDHIGTHGDPPDTSTTSATSGASEAAPPTTGEPGTSTTTGDDPGVTTIGSGATSEPATTTTDDPLAPPAIVEHELGPSPLQQAGPIDVAIGTVHADGVRMRIDDGASVELTVVGVDNFVGEIAVYTALDNGEHTATFVAWRDDLESEPLAIPFTVALPPPGSELFWEGDSAIGKGTVVALAVTPTHDLIELGTYYPQGQARCYLRRRDLGGAWGPGDLVELKPGLPCSAIDLTVDEDGALHVLADKIENGELRWWLGKIDAWAAEPANVGTGAVGDVARALATDNTRVAVCGTKPKDMHLDAAVWIFVPNATGKSLSYDYMPGVDLPTRFSETPRDCGFLGDHLVLTGGMLGLHEGNDDLTRHFVLDIDLAAETPSWLVAGEGPGSQSEAKTLSIDAEGRIITGGHSCGDICEPQGELRLFSSQSEQLWQRTLDPSVSPPRAITWHPAEYAVFASARNNAQDASVFLIQAWFPLGGAPAWTYEHQDGPAIHTATAIAIGPYGQIYAGGTTAGGYPAIAFIAP